MRSGGALAALALLVAAGAGAQSFDLSGDLSLQGRWYPRSPAFPGQRSSTAGMVVEPTLHADLTANASFTLTPLYRYDSADSRRTHADLREAYFLMYGGWGDNAWELRLGLDRVFWGVAELHNLVDVVNQLDLVEHPRNRPKLGQPMAHLTVSGDWGMAEAFVLPYHRKRTFPGRGGRLRSGYPIDKSAAYESGAEERHVDFAARYSNAVGILDLGLSAFRGTSREPAFLFGEPSGPSSATEPSLTPYYEQIRQFGVDAQITTGPWLIKTEAIHRAGASNLLGQEEDYQAYIFGLERSLHGLFGSSADLTVLAEWLYDDRGRRAPSIWANDLFIAAFLALNDVRTTEAAVGILGDLRHNARSLNLELKRHLSQNWTMRLEAIIPLQSDPRDLTYAGRRDSFVGVDFTYSF
ncbi:MAG: hypothetical protein F4X81_00275 [Gammaproteobacteria bacterium]|nr:hypothetical protein [Gammaproteobacteria bacterium]MYE49884.1 hypothetical protein [Gammaproteobacteria bacterium]